jgi:hypothetical protein
MRRIGLGLVVFLLMGCGGDAAGPARPDVSGTYLLTALAFDPQGVLPEVDLLPRLSGDLPRLVLAPAGQAQVVFEDPATGLVTVANGTYSTTQNGVHLDFGADGAYRNVLLSRRMTFESGAGGTLTFMGAAPDGVSRQRLVQLVPEFAGEQLLDPVPGQLTVVFTRSP